MERILSSAVVNSKRFFCCCRSRRRWLLPLAARDFSVGSEIPEQSQTTSATAKTSTKYKILTTNSGSSCVSMTVFCKISDILTNYNLQEFTLNSVTLISCNA